MLRHQVRLTCWRSGRSTRVAGSRRLASQLTVLPRALDPNPSDSTEGARSRLIFNPSSLAQQPLPDLEQGFREVHLRCKEFQVHLS